MIKGAFSFGMMAVMIAYIFGEPGTIVTWGTWSTFGGAVLGFLGGYGKKTTSTEIAERD
ncbi:MAG: hypothetical protein H7Z73_05445 [Candidatus Saccharibacteria bacterium]|nr:hypothetical protein [Moraxellaceae bacterium]